MLHPILEIFKKEGSLHHAYLITGGVEENLELLRGALGEVTRTDIDSYSDFFLNTSLSFGIDDSRELIERQKTRSFSGGMRFFVIASHFFTLQAENGLLKVLEEPIPGNHFFILAPKEDMLIPTLRSRLFHLRGEEARTDDIASWCKDFIGSDLTSRMVMIDKLLKVEEDSITTKRKIRSIFNRMEELFAGQRANGVINREVRFFLSKLSSDRSYLDDTSPSVKLILEHMAFICPFEALGNKV